VVPALGGEGFDDEAGDVASHCVHLIRNQIESIRAPHEGYLMSMSSPFQGDGKTSLVLSIGRSYAISGHRVLLVDCDLVGRSLTRQLGLGQHAGLRDAIVEGDTDGAIATIGMDGLDVMPAGLSPAVAPETLRRQDLETLFDALRPGYDIVIIDTGPLLGSLESAPVTAAVDGMTLVVRRGRSRARLEECLARVSGVGTHCLGVILNCATRADCIRSVSEASLVAVETDGAGPARRRVFGRDVDGASSGRNPLLVAMERTQGPNDAEAA
jgi:tyrosine-protein kinase Etk/Wzc